MALTRHEAAVIAAFTGVSFGDMGTMRMYIEKKIAADKSGRRFDVFNKSDMKDLVRDDFIAICNSIEE